VERATPTDPSTRAAPQSKHGDVHPLAELGLDLVQNERAWQRLPRWDPRLWQPVDDGLQCKPTRNARSLSTLGLEWAKGLFQRSQHKTPQKLTPTRPSHGRPQRSEDGRKGGGTARAGSAHSARRQATRFSPVTMRTVAPAEHASTRRAGRGWAARQAYGAKENDYRPDRWKGFREDYGFTGKEEDVEVGLTYFGKRFLSPYLGRWVSADPLAVHDGTAEADHNLYAYVRGFAFKATDPRGLKEFESYEAYEQSQQAIGPRSSPPARSAIKVTGWRRIARTVRRFGRRRTL
jgi:RHS repeat-associated protein